MAESFHSFFPATTFRKSASSGIGQTKQTQKCKLWKTRSLTQISPANAAPVAFMLAVALGSYVVTELRAHVVVVPNVLATNDGNSFALGEGYPFTTPFLHDPADGNLLLELQTSSSGAALQWDEVTANSNPSVRTVLAPGSPNAPTGSVRNSAVYQFTFAAPALATIRASQGLGVRDDY